MDAFPEALKENYLEIHSQKLPVMEIQQGETKNAAEAVSHMKKRYPDYKMDRFLTYGAEGYFEQKSKTQK